MRCPLLRDEKVRSCRAAPFRKSLARSASGGEEGRCSTPAHAFCPVAPRGRESRSGPCCPFLEETFVQFCAAAPVPTYVPWSSSPEARCGHDGHRFCESFRAAAGDAGRGPAHPSTGAAATVADVEGVPAPGWLYYAENHAWLDPGDDDLWHLGLDAFLARVVGSVERLAFLAVRAPARPAVVLTVRGVDLTLVFPRGQGIVAANTRLRSRLDRLTADPYGLGWLFTVRAPATPSFAGLRRGAAAREWMANEVRRLEGLVHACLASRGDRLAADGGRLVPDLLARLEREEALRLLADLFPLPDAAPDRPSAGSRIA